MMVQADYPCALDQKQGKRLRKTLLHCDVVWLGGVTGRGVNPLHGHMLHNRRCCTAGQARSGCLKDLLISGLGRYTGQWLEAFQPDSQYGEQWVNVLSVSQHLARQLKLLVVVNGKDVHLGITCWNRMCTQYKGPALALTVSLKSD